MTYEYTKVYVLFEQCTLKYFGILCKVPNLHTGKKKKQT